jgi:hypothetical protein
MAMETVGAERTTPKAVKQKEETTSGEQKTTFHFSRS